MTSFAANNLNKRLQRGGAWVMGGRTVGMATVFAIYAFLARVMPTEGFAAFVLISSVAVFFSMAAMFGLNTLVCRYISESFGVEDATRARAARNITGRLAAVSVLGVGCLSWLSMGVLGDVIQLPEVTRSALLIAIWIMLLSVTQILAEVFRGLHDLRTSAVLSGVSGGSVTSALFLVSVFVASWFVPIDFVTVVLLSITSLMITSLGAAFHLYRTWPRQTSNAAADHDLPPLSMRSVAREAIPVMLVQLFSFGLAQLDIWIVGACCGSEELAIYGVVRRLSLLVAIPLTQISMVVASSISELYARGDRQHLQRILKAAATVSVLVMAVPALALAVFPQPVLELVFGDAFGVGAGPLRILLLGQLVFALTGPCGSALMMTGRQRVSLWSLIATLPIFALAPLAATYSGLAAVAMVFAVTTSVQNFVQWIMVRRLMGLETQPCFAPTYILHLFSHLHPRRAPLTV